MKKIFAIVVVPVLLIVLSCVSVSAESMSEDNTKKYYDMVGADKLYDSLSNETKELIKKIGVAKPSADVLSDVTFSGVVFGVLETAAEFSPEVFSGMGAILGVMVIYSISEGVGGRLTHNSLNGVTALVTTLCISAVISLPVCGIISEANKVIISSSDFMLAYIPVMLAVMISCGNSLSGAGYYTLMNSAAQVVSQLSSKLVTPLLNVFLGLNLCNTLIDGINLSGLLKMFSKTIKWILSFSFTLFSALLTFKSLISSSVDSVSTRAVRYTMSSFVPVVGSALSEAYRTVRGSVLILKNGIGVFVIFAVLLIFLPMLVKLILWMMSISLCKTFGEMLSLKVPCEMLSGVSTVLSVLLAVILCIIALFIISTALIMTISGSVT